jgi:vacuolar-type H+-ATPase subunit H
MSDMLDTILGLEKNAAALIAEAEADAAHRVALARGEAQRSVSEVLKKTAREGDAAVEAERARVTAERERLNGEYREKLSRQQLDPAAFGRAVIAFIEKGGA